MNAILNYKEYEVPELIRQIRASENLNDVAKAISSKNNAMIDDGEDYDSPMSDDNTILTGVPKFEMELSGKMGELRLENGSLQFLGGTSNLLFLRSGSIGEDATTSTEDSDQYFSKEDALLSWTEVTKDSKLVIHLMQMYFTWHYTYFTTLSKSLFYRDFVLGKPAPDSRKRTRYCSSLLVNAMLALGCHFTSWEASREVHLNSATAGDHFFREAKRLIMLDGEWENPRLTTVQALALMSVREAGCGREAKGWVYSGMSFRMAYDLGLNVDSGSSNRSDVEIDARKVTIWGCFLFDKYDSSLKSNPWSYPCWCFLIDVGQIIWGGNLSFHSQASQLANLKSFPMKTPVTGLHTRMLALLLVILNRREPVLLPCRYLPFVKSAGICCDISIILRMWKNQWGDRRLRRSWANYIRG